MNALCPSCGAANEATESSAVCTACGARFVVNEAVTNPNAAPADPLIGSVIAGCKLLERVGHGGMGIVYKAEQLSLGRAVAVKLLPESLRSDPQLVERFKREIVILAKLNHPTIVNILDGGVADQGLYFVMEYVDGVSLRRVLASGGLRPEECLQIVRQLCDALEYAHGQNIIHRDIKPENILIDREGRVRLLDFGLSRITNNGGPGLLTRATQVLGTFEYMAPEQREASRDVDHRADLYSLGVVIYEMLTNELPIGKFDPPSRKNIQIDVRLDDVVLRSLEKSPDRRYQRAMEVKTDVDRISTAPKATDPPPPEPPPILPPEPPRAAPPSAAQIYNSLVNPRTPPLVYVSIGLTIVAVIATMVSNAAVHNSRFGGWQADAIAFGGGMILLTNCAAAGAAAVAWIQIARSNGRLQGIGWCGLVIVCTFATTVIGFLSFLMSRRD